MCSPWVSGLAFEGAPFRMNLRQGQSYSIGLHIRPSCQSSQGGAWASFQDELGEALGRRSPLCMRSVSGSLLLSLSGLLRVAVTVTWTEIFERKGEGRFSKLSFPSFSGLSGKFAQKLFLLLGYC